MSFLDDILSRLGDVGQTVATGVGALGKAQRLGPNYQQIRQDQIDELMDASRIRTLTEENARISQQRSRLALDQDRENKQVADEAARQYSVAASGDTDDEGSPVGNALAGKIQAKTNDMLAEDASNRSTIRRNELGEQYDAPLQELELSGRQRSERMGAQAEAERPAEKVMENERQRIALEKDKLGLHKERQEVDAMNSPAYRARVSGGAGLGFMNNASQTIDRLNKETDALHEELSAGGLLDENDRQTFLDSRSSRKAFNIYNDFNTSFPGVIENATSGQPLAEQDIEALDLLIQILTEQAGVSEQLWPPMVQRALIGALKAEQAR